MKELTATQLAAMIDHTFLSPAGAPDAVARLCREARKCRFGCVMVNPAELAAASAMLKGSGIRLGTVIDFPLGAGTQKMKELCAMDAIAAGALDLDFVANLRLLKAAARDRVAANGLVDSLRRMNGFLHALGGGIVTKLIIECCYLTDDEKRFACSVARRSRFDFVKTSTGFGSGGATARDVTLLKRAAGRNMGVKAAGGIRTLAQAMEMIDAGATRIGTSAGVAIMQEFSRGMRLKG